MPVQIDPLRRHGDNDHSGWGKGAVHDVIVLSSHPDPCLLNGRWIRQDEGLQRRYRLSRYLTPVTLDARIDRSDERHGVPLVPVPACHNYGADEAPGFW